MSLKFSQGIVTRKILSIDDISAIRCLAAACEEHEQTRLRINWSMLQTRPGDFPLDFLYYDNGQIVGYIALDDLGVETKELFGMVHPAYRRRGIFRRLFQAALDICRLRGIKHLILICERASPSGQAFIKSAGAIYDFSEHEMVLSDFSPRGQFDDRLSIRFADVEDIDALVFVQSVAFDDPAATVRQRIANFISDPSARYILALFGEASVGCREPVGSLRLDLGEEIGKEIGKEIGIYAFGIHPSYRGRGYGRQMLEEAIYLLHADQHTSQKAIMLDVETDNLPALSLYHSCGFHIRATYDYYNCFI